MKKKILYQESLEGTSSRHEYNNEESSTAIFPGKFRRNIFFVGTFLRTPRIQPSYVVGWIFPPTWPTVVAYSSETYKKPRLEAAALQSFQKYHKDGSRTSSAR